VFSVKQDLNIHTLYRLTSDSTDFQRFLGLYWTFKGTIGAFVNQTAVQQIAALRPKHFLKYK